MRYSRYFTVDEKKNISYVMHSVADEYIQIFFFFFFFQKHISSNSASTQEILSMLGKISAEASA